METGSALQYGGGTAPRVLAAQMPKKYPALRLYYGADSYRRITQLRADIAEQLDGGHPDFDMSRLNGRTASREDIATAMGTPPFTAPRRVVLIEDGERLNKPERDTLIDEVERTGDDPGVVVFVDHGGGKKPNRALSNRAGAKEEFGPFKNPKAATGWLQTHARQTGGSLNSTVAHRIVEAVGHEDAGQLAQELAKLHAMAGGPITAQDVTIGTGVRAGESHYDLYDYVGTRRAAEALGALRPLLRLPDFSGVRLAVGLAIHLSKIGHARALLDEGTDPGTEDGAFRGWYGAKYVKQARHWTLEAIDDALSALAEADHHLKTGGDDERTLTLFIGRVCAPPTPSKA